MSDEHKKEIDAISGVETTGHEWDGLKELNNPAPRWWVIVWVITIIWAIGYWVVYPAWPTLSGNTKGMFGWTEYQKLEKEQAEIASRQQAYLDRFEGASFDEIMKDPELYAFAIAGGNAAFKDNCAVCHGSGAEGSKGYPNLNDDDWLWGGDIESIYQTIQYGIRAEHDDTRISQMPSFGKDGLLEAEDINAVVAYVQSLSAQEAHAEASEMEDGATVFADNCAACHGEDGTGMQEVGAPNLTDEIWLYGGDHDTLYETVFNARAGLMPTWSERLDDNTIRQLAVYVHQLGGGQASASDESEEMTDESEVTEEVEPEQAVEEMPQAEEAQTPAMPEDETVEEPKNDGETSGNMLPEDGAVQQ